MKKFLAIILALVMALSLVACGSTPAQQPDSSNDANAEVTDGVNIGNTDANVDAPVVTDGAVLGEGAHSFVLEITDAEGKTITATINTDEETVGAALLKLNIVQGEDSEYGLYVKTVNGVTADYEKDQTYWSFYIDGEYAQTGVDMTAVNDGSTYKLAVETMAEK